ncbi:MAG: hypothetical protein FWC50_14420 [Planctomycetaceae bacterium]|nr:hypothetical protein [Planctomycetaceae bacterium]
MNEKRREILLGYLLGALESREEAKVEQELQHNDSLQQDLAELYREIAPVMSVVRSYPPPPDLAKRTSKNIWKKIDSRQKRESNSASDSEKQSAEQPFSGKTPQPHFPAGLPSRSSRHKITVEVTETTEHDFETKKPENRTGLPNETQVVTEPADMATTLVSVPLDGDEQSSLTTHIAHSFHTTTPAPLSARSNMALLSETPSFIITKQPKYYGKQEAVSQKKRPWKTRDVIASVSVGIIVTLLLYPLVQFGITHVREAIFQQKVREFGQNIPAGSSQYSTYGLSPNDLMLVNNMNLDSDSAARYQQSRNDNQQKEQPNPPDGK